MGARDERENIRRNLLLPLYFTVISLMVSHLWVWMLWMLWMLWMFWMLWMCSGSVISVGSLGHLLPADEVQVSLPSPRGQTAGRGK